MHIHVSQAIFSLNLIKWSKILVLWYKNVLFHFLEKNNKMRNEIIYAIQRWSRVILCKQKYNPINEITLWKKYKKKAIRLGFIYGELWVRVMVFNATFNNISVVSWQSVLLVGVLGEHHRLAISHSHTII